MGMLGRAILGLAALVSGSGSLGCIHESMQAMGRYSPAPYTDLVCDEPGNPEGFSFRIPECECNAGIRMRYRVTSEGVRYEYEGGTNSEETSDDVYVVLLPNGDVESVTFAGRQLSGDEEDGIYEMARESAFMMWENYSPLIDDLDTTCIEERLDDESERRSDSR